MYLQVFNKPNNMRLFIIFIKNNIVIIQAFTSNGIFFYILYNYSAHFINLSNHLIYTNVIKKINIHFLLKPIFALYYLYRYYLKLRGLGFSIKYLTKPKHTLLFNLGFSKVRYIKIPQIIKLIKKPRKKKYIFSLFSTHNTVLSDFTYLIRKLKMPDPYKLKGFRYIKEMSTIKTGKKKK